MKSIFGVLLILLALCCYVLMTPNQGWSADKQAAPAPQANKAQSMQPLKNREIQAIKPKKPVRIKLHRNAAGQYSWDISGDSADDVFRADSRLKRLLKIEDKNN